MWPSFRFRVYVWNAYLRIQIQADTLPSNWLNSGVELPTSILALTKWCLSIYEQMQAIDRIRDRIKPQATWATPASTSIRQVTYPYQRLVTNTYVNTLFLRFSSSITGTITPRPQHSDEEQVRLMREGRCFSCKERGHTAYDCPRKGKIAALSESISKDSNSQEKE